MLNPYFLQGSSQEQNLVQSLINEQLRMYGVDVHYLPRKYVNEKTIIREVSQSKFDDAYPIEAYVDSFDGYGDNPTLLSKFGIQATNEITLIISKERFESYISPLIKNETNIKLSTRPKEGDLIYFPLGDRLFEIKYVEHEKPFYQLQKNYVYELKCELFRYEGEVIDTGIDEIDDTLEPIDGVDGSTILIGPSLRLNLAGEPSRATATVSVVNGGIQFFTISNRGSGYTYAPKIGIGSAPSGGVTGIATATLIGGIVVCTNSANPGSKSVQNINVVNAGSGYTVAPTIKVSGGGGTGAAATAVIENGVIGIVTVTSGGSGYTTTPTITFTGVSTVSAAATAILTSSGTISAIHLTNAGAGYTQAPTITIAEPTSLSTGNFQFNEVITGSRSGATARVRSWNASENILDVYEVTGTFVTNENVVGSTSSASHAIRSVNDYPVDDGYVDNQEFELEADAILDFSEINPFGQP
jgi:hypothetical protein